MFVCNHVYMYTCIHACMNVCMYVCVYTCMYACMHVCMYVCIYLCIYLCICVSIHVMDLSPVVFSLPIIPMLPVPHHYVDIVFKVTADHSPWPQAFTYNRDVQSLFAPQLTSLRNFVLFWQCTMTFSLHYLAESEAKIADVSALLYGQSVVFCRNLPVE